MFDLGWTELLVIGVVALIVVGPKDLPILFRKAGQFMGKAKGMAREFSRAMDDAADESGMKSAASDLRKMANPSAFGMDAVKDAAKSAVADLDPTSETGKLSAERKAAAAKISAVSARKAAERMAREAEEALKAAEAAEAKAAEVVASSTPPEAKADTPDTKAKT